MTTKKASNPIARQIDEAKKSVKEWPEWMQEIAYFSTTSGTVGTSKRFETATSEKKVAGKKR